MRVTLKTALLGVLSTLLVLLAVQGWLGISKTQAVNANAEDLATNWLPSVRALSEIKFLVTRLRLAAGRAVMTSVAEQRRAIGVQAAEYDRMLGRDFKAYEALIASPEESKIWADFKDKWQAYLVTQKRSLDAMAAGNTTAAVELFNTECVKTFDEALAVLDSDVDLNNKGAERAVADAQQTYGSARLATFVTASVAILIGGLAGLFIFVRVTTPLQRMTRMMSEIADGNLDAKIAYTERHDEIGAMAKALLVFKENGLRVRRMEGEQKEAEQRAVAQRKADMVQLADAFEGAVGEIIQTVSSASTELEASASTLTSTAERAQERATMVAAASEEASANVQSVASATEELSSSVNEISRQVQESARIASEAVKQADVTNDRVSELSRAATRIGDVVELINTIAGQTNLLALNATIEAARAGEAGRGFAVVASEVKALAEQTAKATGEIGQQISGIQAATQDSVKAIQQISGTISQLAEISSTIAAAVEEQGAATQEISRNVQQAAQGTEQVSTNITDVQRGATETGTASSQVLSAAQSLSTDSNRLKLEVSQFLDTVRAA
ncbi:methyl-accepting chemotaxis sensory transducer [Bradyrhizobium macuxiense]|uniref:Methyl-accepting chemotaxis sensory transducer n=1 Tax=Bradyrhizobium macuxiense TaxID=1755647 RepID=A0A560KWZ4_9BRAD|nr:methyl-accepting chemotaxis protein [Bradyrhizobium macuxiense]TWB87735.1 methyl-accepting chemotaxis sensory transducer [Bradyrhizobium macuxiense]